MLHHPALADLAAWFVAVLLSPFVPLVDDAAAWWTFSGLAYEEQIRIARERGEPVTLEEMQAFYPTSPSIEQATTHWLAAIEATKSAGSDGAALLPFVGGPEIEFDAKKGLTDEQLRAATTYLENRKLAIELVRDAREVGSVARFPVEFSKGYWGENEYLKSLRHLSNDLRLSTEVHLARGETSAAVGDTLALLAAAESLRNEPLIISQLVRAAIVGVAWEATQGVFERGKPSDADLKALQETWARMEFLEGNRRALIGERFTLERVTIDPPAEARRDGDVMRQRWAKRIDAGQSMAMFRRMIDGLEGATYRTARDVHGDSEVMIESFIGRKGHFFGLLFINTAMQIPATQAAFSATCRAQASAALSETLFACERFRRAKSRWPRNLAELVPKYLPEVPEDPFGADRLSYRLEGQDAVLYSFGMNGRDEGGTPHELTPSYSRGGRLTPDPFSNDMVYRLVPKPAQE